MPLNRYLPLQSTPLQTALRSSIKPQNPIDHSLRQTIASLVRQSPENAREASNFLKKRLQKPLGSGQAQLVLGVVDVCVEKGGDAFIEIWAREGLDLVVDICRKGLDGEKEKSRGSVESRRSFRRKMSRDGGSGNGRNDVIGRKCIWTAQRLIRDWAMGIERFGEGVDSVVAKNYNEAYETLTREGVDFERAMKEIPRPRGPGMRRTSTTGNVGHGKSSSRSNDYGASTALPNTFTRNHSSGPNNMASSGSFTFWDVLNDSQELIGLLEKGVRAYETQSTEEPSKKKIKDDILLMGLKNLVQRAMGRIKFIAEHSNNFQVISTAVTLQSKASDVLDNLNQLCDVQTAVEKSQEQLVEIPE